VQALRADGHQVHVVRSEDISLLDSPAHPFGSDLLIWNDQPSMNAVLSKCDAVVYQIGDHFLFHRGCVEWLPRQPGVVCLHDYFVGNLFNGWAQQVGHPVAASVVRAWYGDAVASRHFSYRSLEEAIAETHERAPMTEWIASQALAVVTHSSWDIERILRACPGPVRVVPLAYDAQESSGTTATSAGDRFRILTIGHLNANKRPESVIAAIGASDILRDRTTYRLVGAVDRNMKKKLTRLANERGVDIEIDGEVDDASLRHAIHQAHVVSCLRFPSLEAASASTIEAMLHGKAIVVTDVGFYRELPSDCVRKISPEQELPDLRRELESLFADESERNALGRRARSWAEKTFAATSYAGQLVATCVAAAKAAPLVQASAFFGSTLASWGANGRSIEWLAAAAAWNPPAGTGRSK